MAEPIQRVRELAQRWSTLVGANAYIDFTDAADEIMAAIGDVEGSPTERVRALHIQKLDYKGRPYCEECASLCHSRSGLGCDDVDGAWPCATIAALDGEVP